MKVYALMVNEYERVEWTREFSSLDEVLEEYGLGIIILTFERNNPYAREKLKKLWGPQAYGEATVEGKAIFVEVLVPGKVKPRQGGVHGPA